MSLLNKMLNKRCGDFANGKNRNTPFENTPRKFLWFRLYKKPRYYSYCSFNELTGISTKKVKGMSHSNWENNIKKLLPIQFWVREKLLDFINDWFGFLCITYPDYLPSNRTDWKFVDYISAIDINPENKIIRKSYELKTYIHDLLFPYNVIKIKTINRHWHDRDTVLLHASMQILVDYFEQEERWTVELYDKELEVLKSSTNEEREYRYEQLILQKENYLKVKEIYDWWKSYSSIKDKKYAFEDVDTEKENEMLKKLIDVRSTLWS